MRKQPILGGYNMAKAKAILNEYYLDGTPLGVVDIDVFNEYQEKFISAEAKIDTNEYDIFELLYRGSQTTTSNINTNEKRTIAKTNVVRNMPYELIESQVNVDIPEPQIISKKAGFTDQAKMIQEKIKSDLQYLDADKMADSTERSTYKNGIAVVLLNWNPLKGNHNENGEKEFIDKHPKQFIPQNGIYKLADMDHFFFMGVGTKDYIWHQYGVDVDSEPLEYPEVNYIQNERDTSDESYSDDPSYNSDSSLINEIVCIYHDDDNDIGKITWVGSTIVEFLPKYYYPRTMYCKKCGFESEQDATKCAECGSKAVVLNISTFEITENDMYLTPLSYPSRNKYVKVDETTKSKTTQVDDKERVTERMIPAGTKINRFNLNIFPIAVRINIPKPFSFRGVSDLEIVRTLQESLKKVLSRIEEKILLAPAIIGLPKKLDKSITNRVYDVIEGNIAEIGSIKSFDLQVNIQQDMEYASMLYEMAKSTIGVTDAFQGKYDPSARTGKAKEVQVQQSAGRLSSKYKNKYIFFADLFKLMYYFDLIFTSEKRSYVTEDNRGNISYKEFDKYEMLCQDKDKKWYYNTDIIFKARKSSEIPSDDVSLMENILRMKEINMINNEMAWQMLDNLNYPLANKMIEQMRGQSDQKVAIMLEALQALPPEAQAQFLEMPIDQQLEAMKQIVEEQQKAKQSQAPGEGAI